MFGTIGFATTAPFSGLGDSMNKEYESEPKSKDVTPKQKKEIEEDQELIIKETINKNEKQPKTLT